VIKTSEEAEEKGHNILKCGFNPHKATVHDVAQYNCVFKLVNYRYQNKSLKIVISCLY
jgi:hypothetical protein